MTARGIRVGVLVSGRGSNLRALLEAGAAGKLPLVEFRVVLSNQPDAPALDSARAHGVAAEAVDHRPFGKDRTAHEEAVLEVLRRHEVDFVVLAGYMRILTPHFVGAFPGRMINIHPSLLPAFPGVHAQKQAFDYGTKVSGCTVHFVNEEMDAGPVIVQRAVPVYTGDDADTLAGRILAEEHRALPYALDLASRGRLVIAGRHVLVLPGETSFPEMEPEPARLPIVVATGNAHKVEEIRAILEGVPAAFVAAGLFPGMEEPEETAEDYLGNARIKARAWQERTGLWALADDSGLEVDALSGRPGVHSSRYAATTEERIAKLLEELRGVPEEKRTARFVCVAVLCGPEGEEFHARGTCEGRIALSPSGEGGFGYDPVFLPEGFEGSSLAELGEETKNRISHRAHAMEGLREAIAGMRIRGVYR